MLLSYTPMPTHHIFYASSFLLQFLVRPPLHDWYHVGCGVLINKRKLLSRVEFVAILKSVVKNKIKSVSWGQNAERKKKSKLLTIEIDSIKKYHNSK